MAKLKDKREGNRIVRSVSIDIPDREKDEDPITKNQLMYIKKLAPGIKLKGGLRNLGKWQASAVIEQLKEKREELEYDVAEGNINEGSKLKKFFWLVVIIIIVYFVVRHGL